MERISFTSDKVGGIKLRTGLYLKFVAGVAMVSYEEAKEVVDHPRYKKVFQMTPYGEKVFKAYQEAEKAGKPLESVVVQKPGSNGGAAKAAATRAAKKAAAEKKAAEKKAKAEAKAKAAEAKAHQTEQKET